MTCEVKRNENMSLKSMKFTCDRSECSVALTDNEITAAGGLRAMGWHCAGGKHYCPDHAEEARTQ